MKTILQQTTSAAAVASLVLLSACSSEGPSDNPSQTDATPDEISETIAVADRDPLDPTVDPFLWLEEVEGDDALKWVEEKNTGTLARLEGDERFSALEAKALERYNATDKIAYGGFDTGGIHNFWQDATNVRGLWRRASYESYVAGEPTWETLVDFDALAEAEGENWVYKGRDCLKGSTRCLIRLSRGGGDAVVVREFDLATKSFVEDGFISPESKQWTAWMDENTLMIATSFGDGTMNESGYPTQIRVWQRGTDLMDAALLMEDKEVVFNFPGATHRDDGDYSYIIQGPDFFTERLYILDDSNTPQRIALPEGISFQGFYRDHLVVLMRKDWDSDTASVKAGSFAMIAVDKALAGELTPASAAHVVAPEEGASFDGISIGKDRIYFNQLQDVTSTLGFVSVGDSLDRGTIDMPANGSLSVVSVDGESDRAFVNFESFLTPDTLFAVDGTGKATVASLPERFDASGLVTEQKFATSKDGTKVPYFVIRAGDTPMDGSTPTMLYGYGGFEISLTPGYMNGFSSLWIENGGAYVIANIRGGGEYGPSWHQAALKENRQRAYDDFISVAEDLVSTGLTKPENLGIRGGSNGGLLMGTMFTQRPDLFQAVICAVPLLDMYRYDKLLAGASWVGEYGDPDTSDWDFIKTYSPYQNVFADVQYPEVFFYTSTKDDRVHPGHARKMAARMTEQGHPILYYENTEGGHSAAANLKQRAYTDALQTVYALQKLSD